jgi:predicted peptidase
MDRTFNIFFPKTYNPSKRYPVWVHLHGEPLP